MLTRFGRRPIFNIVRFMSCGKGSKDKCGSNSDGKYSETQCKQKCGTKESNCENRCAEENGVIDWRSKICKSPVKFSTSAIPEIDLSDPCGKRCKPPPPPPEPEECCICYDDIEFCPVTEEMRRRHSIWRLASFATLPILGLVLYIVLPAHHKSQEELEEKIRNSEYVRYPYMHRITKPWWWGDGHHGLFFNPKVNRVPPEFDQTVSEGENKNGSTCMDEDENEYANENENDFESENHNGNENYNGNGNNNRNGSNNNNHNAQDVHHKHGYPYGNGNGKMSSRKKN